MPVPPAIPPAPPPAEATEPAAPAPKKPSAGVEKKKTLPAVKTKLAEKPKAQPKSTRKTEPKAEPKAASSDAPPAIAEDAAPPAEPREVQRGPEPETPAAAPAARKDGPVADSVADPAAAPRAGWLSRLSRGLSKSSRSITGSITSIFTKRRLDAGTLQDLEDVLIQADLGIAVSERIVKAVSAGRYDKEIDPEDVRRILSAEVEKVLKPVEVAFTFGREKPFVILVVGVNGSGKTTTIGKLGAIASGEGYKVMFAACDTFRAAAIEQLSVWGHRVKARTMTAPQGSDAAGLAFDAMKAAKEDGTDILFIDTAGRLHNKAYLMDELDKVVRVIKKQDETAPHAVLLVLDATTGQNAMAQAEAFTKVAGVTGIIMTKLDGTARGGILVAIAEAFKLPVHAIGVGESIEDLQPFDAAAFARAIAGLESA
jgi:fused signal recognition particle receptor